MSAGTSLPLRSMWVSGSPSTQMTPPSIVSSVISMRSTVVLPEPEGPMIATFSPRAMSRSSSSSTVSGAVALGDLLEADHRAASVIVAVLRLRWRLDGADQGGGNEAHDEEEEPDEGDRLGVAEGLASR